jgi:hypothetical protein
VASEATIGCASGANAGCALGPYEEHCGLRLIVCAFDASAGRPPFEVREVRGLYPTHMSVAICSKRKTQGKAALTSHKPSGAGGHRCMFAAQLSVSKACSILVSMVLWGEGELAKSCEAQEPPRRRQRGCSSGKSLL